MKAYISISYDKRKNLYKELHAIIDVLTDFNIEPFIFVDTYKFSINQEKQMMQQAFADIDSSDFVIAETSDKAIGIGVEVGYAIAKQKPVIYLRKNKAEHSTTVSGASTYQIIYDGISNLKQQLKNSVTDVLKSR